jgi:hypothetical protein
VKSKPRGYASEEENEKMEKEDGEESDVEQKGCSLFENYITL